MMRIERGGMLSTRAVMAGDDPPEASHAESRDLAGFLRTLHQTIRAMEQHYEEQRRLYEAATQANHGILLDDILEHSYRAFQSLIPFDRIGLLLLEDRGRSLRARWVHPDAETSPLRPGDLIPMARPGLRALLEAGRPQIVDAPCDRFLPAPAAPSGRGGGRRPDAALPGSMLACPLVAIGKPIGFLVFSTAGRDAYHDGHAELFAQLAGDVSVIVEKGRMYEELQRSHAELEEEVRILGRTEQALRRTQAQLEAANRVLAALAATDGLTGLANRRAFDDLLAREWRRAIRGGLPIALAVLDIDAFKPFNDAEGHLRGDDCLRAVAAALREAVKRPCDLVARFGGEEFAVLMPDTGREPLAMLGERLRAAVEGLAIPHPTSPVAPTVTVSLGLASARPAMGDAPEGLIRAADDVLYRAKRAGRNRVEVADGAPEG